MKSIAFTKYSGCGNDFILIDNRSLFFPAPYATIARQLCQRRLGIGADGVILLEPSAVADHRMRILNSDGSEAEMCGNGIRCLMHFIHTLCPQTSDCQIETGAGAHRACMHPHNRVEIELPPPSNVQWDIKLPLELPYLSAHFLNTGVPHLVVVVDDVQVVDLDRFGPLLRHHACFGPKGTNVNFVSSSAEGWRYRTWERGVEGETLACGTGAVAAALALYHLYAAPSPISLRTTSGELLEVGFLDNGQQQFSAVSLTGPATPVFHGVSPAVFAQPATNK